MKDNKPVNNGLISSVFGSFRAPSGSANPNVVASGMIDKFGSSVTSARNVQSLMGEIKSETNNHKKFASSFDSVFAPFSTKFGERGVPSFGIPTDKTEPNSLTLNPYNPNNVLSLYYAPTGSDLYLNSLQDSGSPSAAESGLHGNPTGWLESGHNIIWAHGPSALSALSDSIGSIGPYRPYRTLSDPVGPIGPIGPIRPIGPIGPYGVSDGARHR